MSLGIGQILFLILLYAFAVQLVAGGLLLLFQKPFWLWRVAALVEGGYLLALWRLVQPYREAIGLRPAPLREALSITLWLNAVALFNDAAVIWLAPRGMVEEYLRPFRPEGFSEWIGLALVALLLAPAIEELLFRGLLLQKLIELRGRRFAVLATTAAFALFHMVPLQVLAAIVPGLLLAAYRASGGSLYVAFLAHATGNTVSFLGLLLQGMPWISVTWEPSLLSGLLALLLTPLLTWLFLKRYPI